MYKEKEHMHGRDANGKKPYERPALRTPTSNQAILFLTGYAYIGNQGARELLEFLFPEPMYPRNSERTRQIRDSAESKRRDERGVNSAEETTAV
jgi:hypothetical protein